MISPEIRGKKMVHRMLTEPDGASGLGGEFQITARPLIIRSDSLAHDIIAPSEIIYLRSGTLGFPAKSYVLTRHSRNRERKVEGSKMLLCAA